MIDLLLKAIDRLIDLRKIKGKRLQARYEEIYKPSFEELQSVHSDYLNMFTELDSRLRNLDPRLGGNDPVAVEALEYIRIRRTALLPIRMKLLAFQRLVEGERGKKLPSEERAFLQSVLKYFFVSGISRRNTAATTVIEKLQSAISSRVHLPGEEFFPIESVEDVQNECRKSIAKLESSWAVSTERFNELRFRYTEIAT